MLRSPHVLYIFTSKSPFRYSGVHFFDVRTSKSAPGPSVFLTFSLQNVLLATAAYNFSTSELPKVLRSPHVLYIFTSKSPFRYSGVHFFDVRTSKSAPGPSVFLTFSLQNVLFATAACNFSFLLWAPTSAPAALTGHPTHESSKNTAFRDFSNIYRGCIFFLLTFALVYFLPTDLTAFLICFSTVHIVGSLLFKFPSITTSSEDIFNVGRCFRVSFPLFGFLEVWI